MDPHIGLEATERRSARGVPVAFGRALQRRPSRAAPRFVGHDDLVHPGGACVDEGSDAKRFAVVVLRALFVALLGLCLWTPLKRRAPTWSTTRCRRGCDDVGQCCRLIQDAAGLHVSARARRCAGPRPASTKHPIYESDSVATETVVADGTIRLSSPTPSSVAGR